VRSLRLIYLLAISFFVCGAALAGDETRFALPGHGTLVMQVPPAWEQEVRKHPGDFPPTIVLTGFESSAFVVMVTPRWAQSGSEADFLAPEGIRAIVEKAAHAAEPQALEDRINIVTMGGGKGPGYYFQATDRAPKPGEFKYMTQGAARVDQLVCTFTILTDDAKSVVPTKVLNMLSEAMQQPTR